MESIIKKVSREFSNIGVTETTTQFLEKISHMNDGMRNFCLKSWLEKACINSFFWQALGKASGWKPKWDVFDTQGRPRRIPEWRYQAYKFHEINLTEGWEKAIIYLRSVCGIEK